MKPYHLLLLLLVLLLGFSGCSDDDDSTPFDGTWKTISDNILDTGLFSITVSLPNNEIPLLQETITLIDTSLGRSDSLALTEVAQDSFLIWYPNSAGDTTFNVRTHFEEWKAGLGIDSLEQIIAFLPVHPQVTYNSASSTPNVGLSSVEKEILEESSNLSIKVLQTYRLDISFTYHHIITDELDSFDSSAFFDTTYTTDSTGDTTSTTIDTTYFVVDTTIDTVQSIVIDTTVAPHDTTEITEYDTSFAIYDTIPLPGTGVYQGNRTLNYIAEPYDGDLPPTDWPDEIDTLLYEEYWQRVIDNL